MKSKSYKNCKFLLLGIFILLTIGSNAQQTYSVFDSSVIKSTRMAQQNEFWHNTYNFPAKPRDLFEFGVSTGLFTASTSVESRLLAPGFSAHLRKALGYFLSMRLQYTYGVAQGINFQASKGYIMNPAWINNGYNPATDYVFYNYRSKVQDLSLEFLASLNNIMFHRQKANTSIFFGGGFGMTAYHTKINALDASGKPYKALFNSIPLAEQTHRNRREIIRKLRKGMDNTYETEAENHGTRYARQNGNTIRPSFNALVGISFKLSKTVNLALENKFTMIHDNLLSGQRWTEQGNPQGSIMVSHYNTYNYTSVGLNFNLGNKATHVEPLWWVNPLDYAYSELSNPRHMKLPKPILDDSDGDGIIDQLDQCPNTPAGVAVNSHGCPLDTDGDGVPDYKDKELITPTYCQPVDADGVGKCPEPECCKNITNNNVNSSSCTIGDLPSISFKNKRGLSSDAKAMLATVASKMRSNATCSINVKGYPAASKASQAECNRRINDIKNYLIEKEGISADRITINCEVGGGDSNTVDIKGVAK